MPVSSDEEQGRPFVSEVKEPMQQPFARVCGECGGPVFALSGCAVCVVCGESRCERA